MLTEKIKSEVGNFSAQDFYSEEDMKETQLEKLRMHANFH